jgi:tetratricopeptide (TPR) repeat protein
MSTLNQNPRELFKKRKRKDAVLAALHQLGGDYAAYSAFIIGEGWQDLPEFWDHGVTEEWLLWAIGDANVAKAFANGYFSQRVGRASMKEERTRFFLKAAPEACIEGIRGSRRFLEDEIWEALQISEVLGVPKLAKRLKEFAWLRKRRIEVDEALAAQVEVLKSYDYLELFTVIAVCLDGLFVEALRRDYSSLRMLHQEVVEAFGLVLEEKLKTGAPFPNIPSSDDCWSKSIELIGKCKDQAYLEKFKAMIGAFLEKDAFDDHLKGYCNNEDQLLDFGNGHWDYVAKSRAEAARWERIGQHYRASQDYYIRLADDILAHDPPEYWKEAAPQQIAVQIAWSELGFAEEVVVDGHKIVPEQMLKWTLALDRNIQDRYHHHLYEHSRKYFSHEGEMPIAEIVLNTVFSQGLKAGLEVGPVHFRDAGEMLRQTVRTLKVYMQDVDEEHAQHTMDFMTVNLNHHDPEKKIRLLETPLIRWGNMYCYISSIAGDKNQVMMQQNRIMREWYSANAQDEIRRKSDGFVNQLATEFESKGFQVHTDHPLWDPGRGAITDIDIVARKGNTIFVLQVKDTFARYDADSIESYRPTLRKAGQQLDVTMAYLRTNPNHLPDLLGIPLSERGSLRYYPLVVSSTPEGNYEKWGEGLFFKISAFELRVILRNTKQYLIDPVWLMVKTVIQDEHVATEVYETLQTDPAAQQKIMAYLMIQASRMDRNTRLFDLWEGEKECQPQHIITAIEQDRVWEGILKENAVQFPEATDSEEKHEAFHAFQQGVYQFKQEKNFRAAISWFEKAVALDPEDFENYCWLADAKPELGLKEDAILLYDQIVAKWRDKSWPYSNAAVTLTELGRFQEALERCDQALSLAAHDKESMFLKLRLCIELHRWDDYNKAFVDFNRLWPKEERLPNIAMHFIWEVRKTISVQNPQSPEDFVHRSSCFAMLRDYNSALHDANKAIDLDPEYSGGWYNRAWLKRQNKMLRPALRDIETAVSLAPFNQQYAEQHASILADLGRFSEAERIYNHTLELDSNFGLAWFNLGVLYMRQGKNDLALKCYERAFDLNPSDEGAAVNLGVILHRLGRQDEARSQFLKAVQLGHDSAISWLFDLSA